MSHLIEVAFKGNRKEFFVWSSDQPPAVAAWVIVEADRGEDLGRVHAIGELAALRARGCTHGLGSNEATQRALRLASADDARRLTELRGEDDGARRHAISLARTHALGMKISDAEWRWDRRKLTFYFTSEKRVDFRNLVRELASKFRARIELRQIGVRDEAKRLDGIGRCGRQYCSASWISELRPVNLGLAKDQKLSLNPTQISGACGRLMCCLRNEHEWYVETRRRFPKENRVVATAVGDEKVVLNDLFRERVTLRRMSDGESRTITLVQLNKELRGEPVETDAETDVVPLDAWKDELLSMTDTVERPIPSLAALRDARSPAKPVQIARAPRPAEKSDGREGRDANAAPRGRQRSQAKPRAKEEPRQAAAPATSTPMTPPNAPPAAQQASQHDRAPDGARKESRRGRRRRGRRGRRGNDSPPPTQNSGS